MPHFETDYKSRQPAPLSSCAAPDFRLPVSSDSAALPDFRFSIPLTSVLLPDFSCFVPAASLLLPPAREKSGRSLCRQTDKLLHLSRLKLIFMVKDLPVHGYLHVFHM